MKITHDSSFTIEELHTDHEEADTKVACLINHAIRTYPTLSEGCVRSSSADIDIPVILIGTFEVNEDPVIVLDNGTSKYRRRIRINRCPLSSKHQKALGGFHSFSGNDFVSSFLRKSKRIWSTHVEANEELLIFFSSLGDGRITDDLCRTAESLACKIYGDRKMDSVDSLRSEMFWNKLRRYGKFYDLSLLPLCASTLRKHTARANYICHIWKNAINPLQNLEPFENNGWLADGNIEWINKPYPKDLS